jgi:hypothetical protein
VLKQNVTVGVISEQYDAVQSSSKRQCQHKCKVFAGGAQDFIMQLTHRNTNVHYHKHHDHQEQYFHTPSALLYE